MTTEWCYDPFFLKAGCTFWEFGERFASIFAACLQQEISFGVYSHFGVTEQLSNEGQVSFV